MIVTILILFVGVILAGPDHTNCQSWQPGIFVSNSYTPECDFDSKHFKIVQFNPGTKIKWCVALPEFLPYPLSNRFSFTEDWYLSEETITRFCQKLLNSKCFDYLNAELQYFKSNQVSTILTENDFQDLVESSQDCVTLIEITQKPASELKCPAHEKYYTCPKFCDTYCEANFECTDVSKCISGCYCQPGYFRNFMQKCVKPENCFFEIENNELKKQGQATELDPNIEIGLVDFVPLLDEPETCELDHEIFTTCKNCENTCEYFDFMSNSLPDRKCTCKQAGCTCKPGFARYKGYCLEAKKYCKDLTCQSRPNESFQPCFGKICGPGTCESLIEQQQVCALGATECSPGCVCNSGYSRNQNGICVKNSKCGRCIGKHCYKNNFYKPVTFDVKTGQRWCAIIPRYSNLSISARFSYALDAVVDIKPTDQAENLITHRGLRKHCQKMAELACAKHLEKIFEKFEILEDPETGEKFWQPITHALLDEAVVSTSSCQDLLRTTPKFPVTCPENNMYSLCGSKSCEPTCQNQNIEICDLACQKGCFCQNEYVRDELSGACIKPENCPKITQTCDLPNEKLSNCKNCEDTCENFNIITREFEPQLCTCKQTGCVCQEGFARVDEFCIEADKFCPDVKSNCGNRPNEIFQPCFGTNICGENTCSRLTGPELMCLPDASSSSCNPGCICLEGYIRDMNNDCIPINSCGRCSIWNLSQKSKTEVQKLPNLKYDNFSPKCNETNADSFYNLIQADVSQNLAWCAIIPRYSGYFLDEKFTYNLTEINWNEMYDHCQNMAWSDCAMDLEMAFYDDEYDGGFRSWPEISVERIAEISGYLESCQTLIELTPKFPAPLTPCQQEVKTLNSFTYDQGL